MRIALLALVLMGYPPDEAPQSLFDGKSLNGWVAEGASEFQRDGKTVPVWTVHDGLLSCKGKGFGFLRFKEREFDDFTLHLEFRMAPGCNSGLGIRTGAFDPERSRATRPSFYSYEIQLADDSGKPPTPHSTGSLYRYVAPKENAIKPAGQWNTIEVTCIGPKIRVSLNGKLIQDVDQSALEPLKTKPLRGFICLQNHGGDIEFRAIEVKERKAGDRGRADRSSDRNVLSSR
ncbi:MAG: DUF1080 domain-containing protein [Paludisphaera borealis]|uniref:3-keto-disaccharide hydrolase n=1 Tax=Paludisphaera borealis TaxID=1387353 RepID=UPI00284A9237|nr:DUF1080 domain-containing protein [Paludisphaera borealis]MDR3618187.1 DUF1080 domain-containing protein [Paludisphaera borealis]